MDSRIIPNHRATPEMDGFGDLTPAWLLSQGLTGNEEQFVRQFLPLVQSWAREEVQGFGQLGRVDPDDFAQGVILKILERFKARPFASTSGPGGFHAYLRRCIRNAVVDAIRAAKSFYQGTQLNSELWQQVEGKSDSLAHRFDTAWANDLVRIREAVYRVRKRVSAVRWEAFRLAVEEGCTGAEVAARLGLAPSQVYDAKYDIAARLRKELASLGYED